MLPGVAVMVGLLPAGRQETWAEHCRSRRVGAEQPPLLVLPGPAWVVGLYSPSEHGGPALQL